MSHRRTTRRVAVGVFVATLTSTMAACSSGGSGGATEGGGELTVALNIYSRTLPYFQDMVRGVESVADENGVTVDLTYGETDPQLQYDQVENALSNAPDGLLIVPVDPSALIPVIQQASDNGIPVVTLANDIDEEGHEFQLAFVGQEYVDIGRQKAQFIVDALGGQGTVGFVHGIRGLFFTEAQAIGATEVFEENPGITVIDGSYTGEFSSDAGLSTTENLLTANPDIDALYFDNDDIALGGILAAQQRGVAMDDITIIGTDGGAPAIEAIGAGDLDMTISLCGYASGVTGMEVLLANMQDGTEPEDRFVPVDLLTITSENLTEAQSTIDAGDC